MLTINDNILAKDFNGEIKVDDINIWNQDTNQFSLYTLVDSSQDIKDKLGIKESYEIVNKEKGYCVDPRLGMNACLVDDSLEKIPITNANDILLVFPFQCGIQFAPGYHILNIRDCLGTTTIEELQKAWKKEL